MIMSSTSTTKEQPSVIASGHPFRKIFVAVESFVAVGGVVGTVMLLSGRGTPSVSVLEPIGLRSWVLPGLWLFATTVVPSSAAAVLAWHRSPLAPTAVLVASTLLAVELLVQLPFLGFSAFQAVFGAIAIGTAALALLARRRWPRAES
jgi:hypothetical protein